MDTPRTPQRHRQRTTWAVRWCGWLLVSWLWMPQASAEALQIELLLSNDSAPYQQLLDSYHQQLDALCHGACPLHPLRVTQLKDWDESKHRDLLITVGNGAAYLAAARHAGPTLHGLIPSQTWDNLIRSHGSAAMGNSSAVFLDQPVSRQLRLLKMALEKEHLRIGIILGPESRKLLPELEREAQALELTLNTATVTQWQDVGPAIRAMSKQIDALLALPDQQVFNRNTLYGILLTTYETRVPVIGYSEALSRAGAMVSLYTSLSDMAQQLAEYSHQYVVRGKRLPVAGPSHHFNVTVNHQVARSLGYQLANPNSLHFQIDTSGVLNAPEAAAK